LLVFRPKIQFVFGGKKIYRHRTAVHLTFRELD
jgi:hypothetical protein